MIRKAACKLGLKFQDSDMECSYQIHKKEIEGKLLNVANLLSITLNGLNLILGIIGTREKLALRSVIFAGSVIGAIIHKKLPQLSKTILLLTSLAQFYFVLTSLRKIVAAELPESYYLIGNVFGLMEIMFALSIKNIVLRTAFSLTSFVLKIVILFDGLSDRTLARGIGMSILYIIYYLYYETLERRNFRIIYESREQLKKFQSLLSNDFPTSVIIMSSDFTSILYSNHIFNNTFGSDESQYFIKSFFERFQIESCSPAIDRQIPPKCNLFDFVHDTLPQTTLLSEKQVLRISSSFCNSDKSDDKKSQSFLYYEIKLQQTRWDSKPAYTFIFHDISDRQLVTALKLADEQKDRVIATVSHELRTPINGIIGLLEILSSKVIDKTDQVYLDYCKSCSRLLLYLVNSILDLSQIRNNKLQITCTQFNLKELLEEIKSLYLFQAEQKNIVFAINTQENLPTTIYTDRHRLIQILINLLGNAFKFTLKGSITLNIYQRDDKLAFRVSDTGIGIKEEDQAKLFKMYGKLERQDQNKNANGVGLGLTITNELVKAINNNDFELLELQSEYGKGSTFSFCIPFSKNVKELISNESDESSDDVERNCISHDLNFDELYNKNMNNWMQVRLPSFKSRYQVTIDMKEDFTALATESPLVHDKKEKTSKRILVVDDNPFNILACSFLLQKLGFEVSKAMSGEECIQLLKETAQSKRDFDLILMDVQMPVMDGLETSKIINLMINKKELNFVPIVVLTANEINERSVIEYKKCGIIDYLNKPLIENELKRILVKWLDKKEDNSTH